MLLYVQARATLDCPEPPVPNLGAQSSVVHFQRELDFTLVILTVAY
jgi:hypothetical protein